MNKIKIFVMAVMATASICAQAQGGANLLQAGQTLQTGQYLYSAPVNYAYSHKLIMQADGNLVLYLFTKDGTIAPKWSSNTNTAGSYVALQQDGNLVVYRPNGTVAWNSRTGGHAPNPGFKLILENSGELNLFPPGGAQPAMWSANKNPSSSGNMCGSNGSNLPVRSFPTCTVTGIGVKIPGFVAAHCPAEAAAQAAAVGAVLGACS